ncbi:hypothetical protein [Hymenobacter sp.]|uniref:hypothetical protein n=1 Tax=Hymenobacter sp. TaxID=1898978 RepID=UPI002ED8BC1F
MRILEVRKVGSLRRMRFRRSAHLMPPTHEKTSIDNQSLYLTGLNSYGPGLQEEGEA